MGVVVVIVLVESKQSYIKKSLFITVKLVVAAASVPGPSTIVFCLRYHPHKN